MARKQTQQEYINDCLYIHDNFYSYEKAVYISGNHKIEITCPQHESFWQLAESHKQGRGCPYCARNNSTSKQMLTQEQAVSKINNSHPNYDTSSTVYKGNKKKVEVVCPNHGAFSMVFNDLAQGHGCQECAREASTAKRRSDTQEFIYKATVVKSSYYSYPRTVYVNNRTKVIITCPIHHDFLQTPDNHLQGAGCPECGKSGFNRNKPATLYILNCGDITKVGITGRTVGHRVKEIKNSGGPDFDILASFYFKDGSKALDLETQVHQWLSPKYPPVTTKFQGSTECFLSVDIEPLMTFVSTLATTESV